MSTEPTAFLYPFIEADESDPLPLLAELAASAAAKIEASMALTAETLERSRGVIADAVRATADRVVAGGRVYVFGNGGSSTDADAFAADLRRPDTESRPAVAAVSLTADRAILTALANDVGYDVVFARQLIAYAAPDDVAVGITTSGGSANVLAAFAEARRIGMLTVAVCGYDGGAVAASGHVDHCIVVSSDSIHRIQEAQSAVADTLISGIRAHLGSVAHDG